MFQFLSWIDKRQRFKNERDLRGWIGKQKKKRPPLNSGGRQKTAPVSLSSKDRGLYADFGGRPPTVVQLACRMHRRAEPCGGNIPPATKERES